MQHTLQTSITLSGVGLHSGTDVTMILKPAQAGHGIIFKRVDLEEGQNIIPACWDHVVDTQLCTVIENEHGARVGTIEHLMAALRGLGIDNLLIEIDGPEVPIMDGSSITFVEEMEKAGLFKQSAPRRAIKILEEISVRDGDKEVRLSPSVVPVYSGEIFYAHPEIGEQYFEISLLGANFQHDIADCRTFGFLKDVKAMRAAGLAQGGSLDNAIVLDDDQVLNPDGLRCTDEFIRHKILDAVGDLALADGVILGKYYGARAGHEMNNKLLHALYANPSSWTYVDLYIDLEESGQFIYPQTRKERVTAA